MALPSLRHLVIIGGLVVAIILGVVWWGIAKAVTIASPTRGPAVAAIYASGTVEPSVMLRVAPKVAGRLESLLVDESAQIKKGDVLARLDAAELAALVDQARARLTLAEREYTRAQDLVARGSGSAQTRDRARSELESARAAVTAASKQRTEMILSAPADGTIIRRDGEVGEVIQANQAIFHMACCAPLRITADVDEEDILRVSKGQKVLIRSDALGTATITGTVADITPKGDPVARSFRVRISFPADAPLLIGMTVEVNIVTDERQDALLIPTTALRDNKIFIVNSGRAETRTVTLGVKGANQTEVVSGLSENDRVIVEPPPELREGIRVRAK